MRISDWSSDGALPILDVNDHDQVFEVFRGFAEDFGTLDRIVINAGLGKGAPLGTGKFWANKETAMTNFIGALAQSEAEIGRAHVELQSLMRNSYAVFCLKKKTQ